MVRQSVTSDCRLVLCHCFGVFLRSSDFTSCREHGLNDDDQPVAHQHRFIHIPEELCPMQRAKSQSIFGCICVLGILALAGCADGTFDESSYIGDEAFVTEFRKDVEITEQVRAEEMQQDDQVRTAAAARDVGPLNELVRHRERSRTKDGSTPAVDIGPTEELERHRQSGGCLKCPR